MLAFALSITTLAVTSGCGTPRALIRIETDPPGARVFVQREGERGYEGSFGPVDGHMNAEPINEKSISIGRSPVEYTSPLEETESGAVILSVGMSVVRRWRRLNIRAEKRGFEPEEQTVFLNKGEQLVFLELQPEWPSESEPTTATQPAKDSHLSEDNP